MNSIRARMEFSFKGEIHALETIIDLDACAVAPGEMPDFHRLLAKSQGIDPISYLYEALETYDIEFDAPTGLAESCCEDGAFDWHRFNALQRDERDLRIVEAIAAKMLGSGEFEAHEELRSALLAAYRAGLSNGAE